MGQALAIVIILVIGMALYNKYLKNDKQNPRKKTGDLIDISEAWISMDNLPYRSKDNLLNEEENDFYLRVARLLAPNYYLLPRIRLADFLMLPGGVENRQAYQSRIDDRAVDFLICSAPELQPQMAVFVENDNEARKKQIRDSFVRSAVEAAGINTITVKIAPLPEDDFIVRQLRKAGLTI